MEFWLVKRNGVVNEVWFDTDGCRSSVACGSMVASLAKGKPIETCAKLSQGDILRALGGIPAQGEHCALLAANTLRAACENYSVHITTENQ
jgi:nitrogen fixation NifU-like protein